MHLSSSVFLTKIFVFLFAGSLLCLYSGCGSQSQNSPEGQNSSETKEITLRVMSYNIHHANPPSEPDLISPEAIAEVIRKEDPDLVALQEVDVNNKRSGIDLNQAQAIAEILGMEFHFVKAIDYQDGFYGNAVLSKFPVLETKDVKMPAMESVKAEDRVWAGVRVNVKGKDLWFGSTHIDFTNEKNNLHQSGILMDALLTLTDPVIVAGDFNAAQDSKTLAFFRSELEWTCPDNDCPPTFPEIEPRTAIDFILYRPQDFFRTVRHEVIAEEYASDHRPVVADLIFTTE